VGAGGEGKSETVEAVDAGGQEEAEREERERGRSARRGGVNWMGGRASGGK